MDIKLLEMALQYDQDDQDLTQVSNQCAHTHTVEVDFEVICEDCNQILYDRAISLEATNNSRPRTKREFTFFRNIPNITRETWDLTIRIFREVTDGQNVPFKRNIILGCLHYAAILQKDGVCFTDILRHTSIRRSRNLSKGIAFVTSRIPQTSPYFIQNHNDHMIVKSMLTRLDLVSELCHVEKLVNLLMDKSTLFNSSHYKTIICGCIYYWLSLQDHAMLIAEFASKVNISVMTVRKKYLGVKLVVYRYALKLVLMNLLKSCRTSMCGVKHHNVTDKEDCLSNLSYNLTVVNFRSDDIAVRNNLGEYLPLTTVTDLCDWNYLLDTVYYDKDNYEYRVSVHLRRSTFKLSDLIFNFKQYDKYNGVSGHDILRSTIRTFILSLP